MTFLAEAKAKAEGGKNFGLRHFVNKYSQAYGGSLVAAANDRNRKVMMIGAVHCKIHIN